MAGQSFDIKTATNLLQAFLESFSDYKQDPLSPRKAITCALFAWHLCDWVNSETNAYPNVGAFQTFVKSQSPALDLLQDVANGSKHRYITRYSPTVADTEVHGGAFQRSAFQRNAFDVSRLVVEETNGTRHDFEDLADQACTFWIGYFQANLGYSHVQT